MSIRQFSSRIELGFWQIVIGLLSESHTCQNFFRYMYLHILPIPRELFAKFERRMILWWAAAGLGVGLVIGFLTFIL